MMKYLIIWACSGLLLVACDKKIDEIRPITKIDKEGELSTVDGIKETTAGLYTLLQGSGFTSYALPLENLGESRGNNVKLRQFAQPNLNSDAFFFQNSNVPTHGYSSDFYRSSYQIIVSANMTLEGIEILEKKLSSFTATEQQELLYAKGENMFLRAFIYFNMVRLYGKPFYQNASSNPGVPLKKTSDLKDMPAPATVQAVYDFVVSELQAAAQLMKRPVNKTNAFVTTGAAWSLLSRAYLYMGGPVATPNNTYNQKAVEYADSVINFSNGKYALLPNSDYAKMFGDDQSGTLGRSIFDKNKEIIFARDNAQTGTSISQIYWTDPVYGGGIFVPSSDFMQILAPGDIRGTFFKVNASTQAKETTKWIVLNGRMATRAPQIYFRTGELYLNRAEAYAKMKNYAKAKADLSAIHTRAGLPAADIDNLADVDVLAAILKERRIEMAFEGQASYDYFRNGLPMKRIAADFNGNELIIQPDDPKVVLPIPAY